MAEGARPAAGRQTSEAGVQLTAELLALQAKSRFFASLRMTNGKGKGTGKGKRRGTWTWRETREEQTYIDDGEY
jgi:hypothetical protein